MTRSLRLFALGALAVAASTAGASAQTVRPYSQLIRPPVGYTLKNPTSTMNAVNCRWVTYTTPYLYEKNACSGEVRFLLR